MIRSEIAVFAISTIVLLLGACAAPSFQPIPEGHPADPNVRPSIIQPSGTLAVHEHADPSPAYSDHWRKQDHDHQENNHHDMNDHQDMNDHHDDNKHEQNGKQHEQPTRHH
jgi:hypothetical protein